MFARHQSDLQGGGCCRRSVVVVSRCCLIIIVLLELVLNGTGEFTHRFSSEGEPDRVVNNAVQNGIGEGGVLNFLMPLIDGELCGKHA